MIIVAVEGNQEHERIGIELPINDELSHTPRHPAKDNTLINGYRHPPQKARNIEKQNPTLMVLLPAQAYLKIAFNNKSIVGGKQF